MASTAYVVDGRFLPPRAGGPSREETPLSKHTHSPAPRPRASASGAGAKENLPGPWLGGRAHHAAAARRLGRMQGSVAPPSSSNEGVRRRVEDAHGPTPWPSSSSRPWRSFEKASASRTRAAPSRTARPSRARSAPHSLVAGSRSARRWRPPQRAGAAPATGCRLLDQLLVAASRSGALLPHGRREAVDFEGGAEVFAGAAIAVLGARFLCAF